MFDCSGCNKKKIPESEGYAIDGNDYCEYCAFERIFLEVTEDSMNSTDPESKSDSTLVSMESSIFTEYNPNLKAFQTVIRAIFALMELSSDKIINRKIVEEEFGKKYKKDFENDILRVLKRANLIKDFDDKSIYPGENLEDIYDVFIRDPSRAMKMLDGLVSIATLSETKFRSRQRRLYAKLLEHECLDHEGKIKNLTISQDRIENFMRNYSVSSKQFTNQRLNMVKYGFFFDGETASVVKDSDTGKITRFWPIKPQWPRFIGKVLVRMREYELHRVRGLDR